MKKLLFVCAAAVLLLCSCTPKNQEAKKTDDSKSNDQETVIISVNDDSPELMLDDAEDGLYWSPVRNDWAEWGNRFMATEFSTECNLNENWKKSGSNSIEFVYAAMPADKDGTSAHYYCTDILETDWTNYNKLTLDVKNPSSEEVVFQFYTKSGDNWAWSDTEAVNIPTGEHEIAFDISTRGVANKSNVLEMGFVIYHVHSDNSLFIDNVKLVK